MSEVKSPIELIKDAGHVLVVRCKDCTNAVIYDGNGVICNHIDSNGNDCHPIACE